MKKVTLLTVSCMCLLAVSMLQGCLYQMVDETDILKAQDFCSKQGRGGVKDIRADFLGIENITCANGDSVRSDAYKIKLPDDASMTDG